MNCNRKRRAISFCQAGPPYGVAIGDIAAGEDDVSDKAMSVGKAPSGSYSAKETVLAFASIARITPPARYFTVTLYAPSGALVANPLGRQGFTSQELIRSPTGAFDIVVSPRAGPGNWLPSGAIERYVLTMRFYDTSLGIATRAGRAAPMPAVRTENCP